MIVAEFPPLLVIRVNVDPFAQGWSYDRENRTLHVDQATFSALMVAHDAADITGRPLTHPIITAIESGHERP